MKRNRIVLLIICLFLLVMSAFATNTQKTYTYDSYEYKLVSRLTQVAGVSGPALVTPTNGDALIMALKRIDTSTLNSELKELYTNLLTSLETPKAMINSDSFKANVDTVITGEINLNKNFSNSSRTLQDLYYQYKDRSPLLLFSTEFSFGNNVYGRSSFSVKKDYSSYLTDKFSTNLGKDFGTDYQLVSPFDTGVSIGNNLINFFIGRGKLNIGNGFTGNMFIADNFNFQDFAKVSFISNFFSYDFTYTHFDQQVDNTSFAGFMTFSPPHQIRISHDYTFNIVNKALLSIHEGIIIESNSAFDIRMFNPFILVHNWQAFDAADRWGNNIASIELSMPLMKRWNLDFQFVLDQIQTGGEVANGEVDMLPNAMGALINTSYLNNTKKGFIKTYFEAVWTNPNLYLNYLKDINGVYDKEFTIKRDYILGYYMSYGSDLSYTGYKYGPGTIGLCLGTEYMQFDNNLSVSFEACYRAHGDKGIEWHSGQSDKPNLGKDHVFDILPTGVVEHTLSLATFGNYKVLPSLSFKGSLAYIHRWNNQNIKGNNFNDVQLSFAISFTPTDFIKKH